MEITINGYAVALTKDDNDTYLVTCRDFPELTTFGDTKEEALQHAVNALEEAIAARVADREDIPAPSKARKGEHTVEPNALIRVKVALYSLMRAKKVKQVEIARTLGWNNAQLARILDIKYNSRMDHLEAVAGAMGASLEVHVVPHR